MKDMSAILNISVLPYMEAGKEKIYQRSEGVLGDYEKD